jgi:hypothetical protein
VTSHPAPDNAGHWWLVSNSWRRLHAIPGKALTPERMRDAIDNGEPVIGPEAACTERRPWHMPGIGSRLALRRCAACCRALGIPDGAGTPANNPKDPLVTDTPTSAAPHPFRGAADALRREAAALDRMTEQLAWPVLPQPEPVLDAATFRAVARHLETLEPE